MTKSMKCKNIICIVSAIAFISFMSFYDIPGVSIALIQDGEVIWSEGYGYQDLEEDKPVNADTLFRAVSITKSVTARGVMNLVEQGYIELVDPLDQHLASWQLPETKYAEEAVTIKQLLSHSSGITGGTDYELPDTERPPLEEVLAGEHSQHQAKLVREPGSSFEYSNQGFIILELLVEDVTGKSYDDYIEEFSSSPTAIIIPIRINIRGPIENSSFKYVRCFVTKKCYDYFFISSSMSHYQI